MQERLETIEIQYAYLQKTVDELNAVVLEQGKEIRELRRLVQLMAEKMREMSAFGNDFDPNEKPPHY